MKTPIQLEDFMEICRTEYAWIIGEIQLEDLPSDFLYRIYKFYGFKLETLDPGLIKACKDVLSARRRGERDRIQLEEFEEEENND